MTRYHLLGLLLGFTAAAAAITHGYQHPTSTLPATPGYEQLRP